MNEFGHFKWLKGPIQSNLSIEGKSVDRSPSFCAKGSRVMSTDVWERMKILKMNAYRLRLKGNIEWFDWHFMERYGNTYFPFSHQLAHVIAIWHICSKDE